MRQFLWYLTAQIICTTMAPRYQAMFGLILVACGGCSSKLDTEYGATRGPDAVKSINGFGTLRSAYENSGWSIRNVNRLNDRLANANALVWVPNTPDTLYPDAMVWLEDWLSNGDKTLVYLIPDDGCEASYFDAMRHTVPFDQRLAYRRRMAKLENASLLKRLAQSKPASNSWFSLDYLSGEARLPRRDLSEPSLRANFKVLPPVQVTPAAGQATSGTVPSGLASTVEHQPLFQLDDDDVIVTQITADSWGNSKIIVVSSGSLLSNFSLTTATGQSLASKVIAETGNSNGLIGFMSTKEMGAVISDVDPEINSLSGMELFTVWPMNIVMFHLAFMGFVACMILLPIFGRPRDKSDSPTGNFGDHLDAVATLMYRSGGESFARRRISDYMKRIRNDMNSVWVVHEDKPLPNTAMIDPLQNSKIDHGELVDASHSPTPLDNQSANQTAASPHNDSPVVPRSTVS